MYKKIALLLLLGAHTALCMEKDLPEKESAARTIFTAADDQEIRDTLKQIKRIAERGIFVNRPRRHEPMEFETFMKNLHAKHNE